MWTELPQKDNSTQYQKLLGGPAQNELLIGTRDQITICYIAIKFGDDLRSRRINQYFFESNQPSGFNLGMASGPGWPLNRPPMSTEYKPHFDELGRQVSTIKESLDACVELLLQPGPTYASERGDSNGTLS